MNNMNNEKQVASGLSEKAASRAVENWTMRIGILSARSEYDSEKNSYRVLVVREH